MVSLYDQGLFTHHICAANLKSYLLYLPLSQFQKMFYDKHYGYVGCIKLVTSIKEANVMHFTFYQTHT